MACEYWYNGNYHSEEDFKKILKDGLLDSLVKEGSLKLPTVEKTEVVTKTTNLLPLPKLVSILTEEINSRDGYPLNILSALELNTEYQRGPDNEILIDEKGERIIDTEKSNKHFKIPLWSSPYAAKFENILNSIVSKKIVKQKFPGTSSVLGSEEGFRIKEGDAAIAEWRKSGVVYSPNFDPSKGLLPMRYDEATKTHLPAQIMIPFKFRDENGEILNVKDFMTDGKLDFDKIPQKVLSLFGFRIPTQERNSMASIEIVGFLPEEQGDLLLGPRDWVAQMGSDFDVDKMYSYMYNTFVKDGKLHTNFLSNKSKIQSQIKRTKEKIENVKKELNLTSEQKRAIDNYIKGKDQEVEENTENKSNFKNIQELLNSIISPKERFINQELRKVLEDEYQTLSILKRSYRASQQNAILDIHHKVMLSTNENVARSVIATDSFGEFGEYAKELGFLVTKPTTTILSDEYQRTKFINAVAGKEGVGAFSLDSTFNAAIQGLDLIYKNFDDTLLTGTETAQDILALNEKVVSFGEITSFGDLSNIYTIKSQKLIEQAKLEKRKLTKKEQESLKYKSTIIRALQSSAVDNEKEQILDKLNINSNTFDTIRALTILGFEEADIVGLLTQPIIKEFVETLKDTNSSLSEYVSNPEDFVYEQLIQKYDPAKNSIKRKAKSLSGEDLINSIKSSGKEPNINNTLKEIAPGGASTSFNIDQVHLLDKFLQLRKIGKDIKVLQSTINTASKGLTKSIIENNNKVEQIHKLPGTNVFNAGKLLGTYSDTGLETPSTINGYAAYHGAMFAQNLFNDYFPYLSSGVQNLNKEIESYTKDELTSAKKAVLHQDIFNNVKSYLFSSKNTGLFTDFAINERNRIFIDKGDNHKSLATIMQELSKTEPWFNRNNFLSSLTYEINKNGEPSRVMFDAASGENFDEKSLYEGFTSLLTKELFIGEFNGVRYTTRGLAQDLIAAAFLEGGTQAAKQYVKFIPPSYLKTMNFGKYLNDFDFTFDDFGGILVDGKLDYNNPSSFTRQFFQNNPSKNKVVELFMIEGTPTELPMSFELTGDFLQNNIFEIKDPRDGKMVKTQTKFLSIPNESTKRYAMYEFDANSRMYHRIPVLGSGNNFDEYSINGNSVSVINKNNPTVKASKAIAPLKNPPPIVDESDKTVKTEIQPIKLNPSLRGQKAIEDLFNQIELHDTVSTYNSYLISEFRQLNADQGLQVELREMKSRGQFKADKNVLVLNKNLFDRDINTVASVTLHELSHGHTSKLIKQYAEDPSKLTKKQREAVENLQKVQDEYIEHLNSTEEGRVGLIRFRNKYLHYLLDDKRITQEQFEDQYNKDYPILEEEKFGKEKKSGKEEKSKYYGAIKLEEFVAMSLTDEGFQRILNDISTYGPTSLWSKFVEGLIKALQSLGLNVNENSLLAKALEETWTLVEANNEEDVNTTPTTGVEPSDFTNHSGGAYGGDTFWDIIGRQFGVVNQKHYKDAGNANLSQKLKNAGVQATILTKEQMDIARTEIEKLTGVRYDDSLQGNLQVRNYYQVVNADSVFAIAEVDSNLFNASVHGGTNTAVKIAQKLGKPVFVWDTKSEKWYKAENNKWVETSTPALTKNFAGIGSRNIESYNTKNKTTGKWEPRKEYLGIDKELKAKQAIRDVYEKTFKSTQSSTSVNTTEIIQSKDGNTYRFTLNNGVIINAEYSQGSSNDFKLMNKKNWDSKYELLKNSSKETISRSQTEKNSVNEITINGISLNTGKIKLNEQQSTALQNIADFIDSNIKGNVTGEDISYTLQGYAGTGKTTITKFILDYTNKKYKSVALASPTHRAKEILIANTGDEGAMTLAKALGLAPGLELTDFNLQDKIFIQQNQIKIPSNGIFIIDESSMINDALYSMILQIASQKGTKVLFIGDDAQLKPVKQRTKAKPFTRSTNISSLTKVMRTADGNPMPSEVLQPIRENPSSKIDMFKHEDTLSPKGEGIKFTKDSDEWSNAMVNEFTLENLENNPNHVRALAYTNTRVKELNTLIRTKMFGFGAESFYPGELLMMYENIGYDPTKDYMFPNGSDIMVKDAKFIENKKIISPTGKEIFITGHEITLVNPVTKVKKPDSLFIADLSMISREYLEELNLLKNKAIKAPSNERGRAWGNYYTFSNQYNLTDHIYEVGDTYYTSEQEALKALKGINPNATKEHLGKYKVKDKSIDYSYAHTIHKSQGGTYNKAFVDENNIDIASKFPNPDFEMINQLKYVGFSRSSELTFSLSSKTDNRAKQQKESKQDFYSDIEQEIRDRELSEEDIKDSEFFKHDPTNIKNLDDFDIFMKNC